MIAILGGGITALSAAHELKKQGKKFILLEANSFLGGKIQSRQMEGYTFELGPNTVVINNRETKELLEDLNLYTSRILPEENAINNRFVLKHGKMEPFPNSLKKAINSKLFQWGTLLSILKEPFVKVSSQKEESLAAFSRRRLSKQILDDFITPFVTGIYAGDPEKMSVNHTMSMIKDAERKHGSIIKGMVKFMKEKKQEREEFDLPKQKIFTFQNGLQELIVAIEKQLNNNIQLNARVKSISFEGNKYGIVYEQDNEEKAIYVDKIISTIPAKNLAELVQSKDVALAKSLFAIHYVSAGVMHLAFDKKDIDIHDSFGLLSRKEEKVPFLGVLFNSSFFPHQSKKDSHLLTIIYGGERGKELLNKSDAELQELMIASLKEVLKIKGKPNFFHRKDWGYAIPQYELGYDEVIEKIENFQNAHPNFYIAGNFYKGISVSDCIANGKAIATNL